MEDKTNLSNFLNLMENTIKTSKEIKFQLFDSLSEVKQEKLTDLRNEIFDLSNKPVLEDEQLSLLDKIEENISKLNGFDKKYKNLTTYLVRLLFRVGDPTVYLTTNNKLQNKIKEYTKSNKDIISYYAYLNNLFETIDNSDVILFLKRIFNQYIYTLYGSFTEHKTNKSPRKSSRFTYKKRFRK